MAGTSQAADPTANSSFGDAEWRKLEDSIAANFQYQARPGGAIDVLLLTPQEVAAFIVARFKVNERLTFRELSLALGRSLSLSHFEQCAHLFEINITVEECFQRFRERRKLAGLPNLLDESDQEKDRRTGEKPEDTEDGEEKSPTLRNVAFSDFTFMIAYGAPHNFHIPWKDLLTNAENVHRDELHEYLNYQKLVYLLWASAGFEDDGRKKIIYTRDGGESEPWRIGSSSQLKEAAEWMRKHGGGLSVKLCIVHARE